MRGDLASTATQPQHSYPAQNTEVAALAGVSIEYYTQLERGNLAGASESVLEALAGALQLDEAERGHLFDLARAASSPARGERRASRPKIRLSIHRILDALAATAYIRNARMASSPPIRSAAPSTPASSRHRHCR